MLTEDFAYSLPPELIAQQPLARRDASRLLVLRRDSRTWEDRRVVDLPDLLPPGALLVCNDTRVIPARLRASREATGGAVEIFLLPPELVNPEKSAPAKAAAPVRRLALTRSGGRLRIGEKFVLAAGLKARLVERRGEEGDLLEFEGTAEDLAEHLRVRGEVPLPPYILRPPGPSRLEDRDRYQTIFAARDGAVAAPTAGLHFTPELLARLDSRGVERAALTLHVGPGTFRTVKARRVEEHRVDPEPFFIGPETAAQVTRARAEGRKVLAVGTTVLRALETRWEAASRRLLPGPGLTDLFIHPPREFQSVDLLLTNFHLPRSSLLMLASAFASPGRTDGLAWLKAAYAHAAASGYRFFSYGDASLFL